MKYYVPFLFQARQCNLFTYTLQIHKYIKIKRKEMPCRSIHNCIYNFILVCMLCKYYLIVIITCNSLQSCMLFHY